MDKQKISIFELQKENQKLKVLLNKLNICNVSLIKLCKQYQENHSLAIKQLEKTLKFLKENELVDCLQRRIEELKTE